MSGNYLGPGMDVWVGIELNDNYEGVYIQVSGWNMSVRQEPPGARPNAASLGAEGRAEVIPSHDPPLHDGELLRAITSYPSPVRAITHTDHRDHS